MDVAFNQHSSHSRRKNRSTTALNRLSLAPLTSKLPLDDHDDYTAEPLSAPPRGNTSYLEAKSTPTTPRLLSRSPGRSHSHTRGGASTPTRRLPKSKSAVHLPVSNGRNSLPDTLPSRGKRRRDDFALTSDRADTDWLLRASAVISSETRESKGQSWLVSRASSTSLAGGRDEEEEAFERELARERELASRQASRRGSVAPPEDDAGYFASPSTSRFGSRSHSRVGSRTQVMSPQEYRAADGYFAQQHQEESLVAGPDFVNLDERLEAIEQDTSQEDEAHVRRLVKRGSTGVGTWFDSVLGWGLFSVEENEEEDDSDCDEEGTECGAEDPIQERRKSSVRQFDGAATASEERMPPPKADEGGWQDAAWLLSVASKVLL